MKRATLLLSAALCCSLFYFPAVSQEGDHRSGELLVHLLPSAAIRLFLSRFNEETGYDLAFEKTLSPRLNIHLVQFDAAHTDETRLLELVRSHPAVKLVQFNHYVQARNIPDDALFPQQWALHNTGQTGGTADADLDAVEAWDSVSGGVTATGDTIVVAVIDGGFGLSHPDLVFRKNYGEAPGNLLDDDSNGYIDDYDGWNAYAGDGNIPPDDHGTHVAGIAAAKGNNGTGITGVSWGTPILPVAGSTTVEATVIEAYTYVLEMRARYNSSGGSQGSFIVSANSSFGVDFGKPADYPLWCAMYDSMGSYGILSAGAVMNANVNVDVSGDIPTVCPSEFLVTVANTDANDNRSVPSGYGPLSVDMGAPGTSVISTITDSSYGYLTGTSMSSPHVTGAIALMYAAACPQIVQNALIKPDSVALIIKERLLLSTDSLAVLAGITTTGGRLNLHKAVKNVSCWYVVIEDAGNKDISALRVYPNPAKDKVVLEINEKLLGKAPVMFRLTDVPGALIMEKRVSRREQFNSFSLDISGLPGGIYLATLHSGQGGVMAAARLCKY